MLIILRMVGGEKKAYGSFTKLVSERAFFEGGVGSAYSQKVRKSIAMRALAQGLGIALAGLTAYFGRMRVKNLEN